MQEYSSILKYSDWPDGVGCNSTEYYHGKGRLKTTLNFNRYFDLEKTVIAKKLFYH